MNEAPSRVFPGRRLPLPCRRRCRAAPVAGPVSRPVLLVEAQVQIVDHLRPPPLRVQPALQDLHRGGLVDDRPLALSPDATFGQPTGCDAVDILSSVSITGTGVDHLGQSARRMPDHVHGRGAFACRRG